MSLLIYMELAKLLTKKKLMSNLTNEPWRENTHTLTRWGTSCMTNDSVRGGEKKRGQQSDSDGRPRLKLKGRRGGRQLKPQKREKKSLHTPPPQCGMESKFSFWLDVAEGGKRALPTQK